MISQNQIARLVELEEYPQLVNRILANGRCRSSLARRVLSQPECAAPAATGLALQRAVELTYAPAALSAKLARKLVVMQRRDGFFGYGRETPRGLLLAATGTALGGLLSWSAQNRCCGAMVDPSVTSAIEFGLAALATCYSSGGITDDDAVGWAIVLWQLGGHAEFRCVVPVRELSELLEEVTSDLVGDDLSRYARVMAA